MNLADLASHSCKESRPQSSSRGSEGSWPPSNRSRRTSHGWLRPGVRSPNMQNVPQHKSVYKVYQVPQFHKCSICANRLEALVRPHLRDSEKATSGFKGLRLNTVAPTHVKPRPERRSQRKKDFQLSTDLRSLKKRHEIGMRTARHGPSTSARVSQGLLKVHVQVLARGEDVVLR